MKSWIPILVILPAGIAIGLVGAQMANPRTEMTAERTSSYIAESERRAAARNRASPFYIEERGGEENNRPGAYRPDLNWDEEAWPGSGSDDYAFYGQRRDDDDWASGAQDDRSFEDAFSSQADARNRSAAEDAALAAERAAEEALEAAEGPSAPAVSAPTQPRASAPPPSREPRTAEGDLPAIW